jgi:hypothetical protein
MHYKIIPNSRPKRPLAVPSADDEPEGYGGHPRARINDPDPFTLEEWGDVTFWYAKDGELGDYLWSLLDVVSHRLKDALESEIFAPCGEPVAQFLPVTIKYRGDPSRKHEPYYFVHHLRVARQPDGTHRMPRLKNGDPCPFFRESTVIATYWSVAAIEVIKRHHVPAISGYAPMPDWIKP